MISVKELPKGIDENLIKMLAKNNSLSQRFTKILVKRGCDTDQKIAEFLSPDKKNLFDPFLLKGVKEAVERITLAKERGETVVVYGDYDADGICATTTLTKSLQIFGVEAYAVIPEREDGYGLTEGVIERVLDEYFPDLIITVDCGISAVSEVESLLDFGVDVIVTDHHEVPDQIPECITINCKMKDSGYPFDGLCGAGVAYKLSRALIGERADCFLDIVALATVADSMPMVGENRIIVSEGVKIIENKKCLKGLKALISQSGIKEFSSSGIAYSLAPRINAAGRMGDAYSALKLLLSEDDLEVTVLADKLNTYNGERQTKCDLLYKQAKEQIAFKDAKKKVIALSDKSWNNGLIGIVAAKLCEEYSKPVVLFVERDGLLHGSARSVENINIFQAINSAKHLIENFGGHAQAAGVTIKKQNLEAFENAVDKYITDNYDLSAFEVKTEVEEIVEDEFTMEFAKELTLLEPYGLDNKKPIFASLIWSANAFPLKFGSPHISFKTSCIEMLYFNGVKDMQLLNTGIPKYVVFEPNISIFNGRTSLKGYVRDVMTVVENSNYTSAMLLENQIENFFNATDEYEVIDTQKTRELINIAKKEVYGTLFVVNNLDNLKYFEELNGFEKCVLTPNGKSNVNLLSAGIEKLPEGFDKVVFIDFPLAVPKFNNAKVYVNNQLIGTRLTDVSVDRAILGNVFTAIKKSLDKIVSGVDGAKKLNLDCSFNQVVFSIWVFLELGFLERDRGFIRVNPEVKDKLENSKLYCKIASML